MNILKMSFLAFRLRMTFFILPPGLSSLIILINDIVISVIIY